MKEISIYLAPPTVAGRLLPRYDQEADLVEIASTITRDWPYGIDIDGRIIFDVDAEYTLANFDLLIPKRLWKVIPTLEVPFPAQEADLKFTELTLKHKSFSLPLTVQTDQTKSHIQLLFGKTTADIKWIRLSERCLAGTTESLLKGFFIIL